MADSAPKPLRARPLSPHLDVYRLTLTMVMSGLHRITGLALYVGVLLMTWFLLALASDASAFSVFSWFIQSIIGEIILFGFTWALFHHMLGGIRHALWDSGFGLDAPMREYLAQGTAVGGLALTVIVWIVAYFVR